MPLAFLVVCAATLLVFFVTSRYRLPLLVPAALHAGLGAERCFAAIRARDMRALAGIVAAGALAAFVVLRDPGVRVDPAMSYATIAGALAERGSYAEALRAADEALLRNDGLSGAWQNRAVALIGLGREEEALRATEEALRRNPDLAEAWNTQGALLARAGEIDEALPRFRRAAELAPADPDMLSNLARALAASGDYAAAEVAGLRAIAAGASDLEVDVARWRERRAAR
jgi:Flp pilus assembly protein TadD